MSRSVYRLLATCVLGSSLIGGCVEGDKSTEEAGSTYAPLISQGEVIDGQYIIRLKDDVSGAEVSAAISRVDMRGDSDILHAYSVIPGFAARLSPGALDALRRDPSVAYIEQDTVIEIDTTYTTDSAGLDRIDQRELPLDGSYNDYGRDGSGVHAFIIDTGINSCHVEFEEGRVSDVCFTAINDGNGCEDCNGHGTHMASIVGGVEYGVAKEVILHAVRVLDCNGSGSLSDVIEGVDWTRETCVGNGWACVANVSLGGSFSSTLNDAVASAVSSGVTFAVAAGGSADDACNYSPASEPSAITVTASDPTTDAFATYANWGSCVDIIAPGTGKGAWVGSCTATNTLSGTSVASAYVAGAVALYLGEHPSASPSQAQAALEGSATLNCIGSTSGSPDILLHNDFNAGTYDCGGGGGSDPNSCEGNCGGQAPGGCWCDSWCSYYGDCCPDKSLVCG